MQSGFVKTILPFHAPSGAIARNQDRRCRLGCRCYGTCGRFADGDRALSHAPSYSIATGRVVLAHVRHARTWASLNADAGCGVTAIHPGTSSEMRIVPAQNQQMKVRIACPSEASIPANSRLQCGCTHLNLPRWTAPQSSIIVAATEPITPRLIPSQTAMSFKGHPPGNRSSQF
jgi:hypothetical protein